ncbi:hypothetical protein ES703_120086 [subsurface metagenome]
MPKSKYLPTHCSDSNPTNSINTINSINCLSHWYCLPKIANNTTSFINVPSPKAHLNRHSDLHGFNITIRNIKPEPATSIKINNRIDARWLRREGKEIGMPVEMSFRRRYVDERGGIVGYFWKAVNQNLPPPSKSTTA